MVLTLLAVVVGLALVLGVLAARLVRLRAQSARVASRLSTVEARSSAAVQAASQALRPAPADVPALEAVRPESLERRPGRRRARRPSPPAPTDRP